MMPSMEHNKPLYIPQTKKWKGLTVYCNKCNTNVSEICKETGKSIMKCPFGEKHSFKVYIHVPGTDNQRKTKKLKTKDINEAIKQAIEFEKAVKREKFDNSEPTKQETKPMIKKEVIAQPTLLIHGLARYIGFLNNEGVPAHRHKERSKEYIKEVERALRVLIECLKQNGHDLNLVRIEDINDNIVGEVFSFLSNKGIANKTFNKHLTFYTSFLKWYSEEYNVPMRNWFERINRKKVNVNPESISYEEYKLLLQQITFENGIKVFTNSNQQTRNLYRPWLADGIRLGLETGRRREELINLKWNKIVEDHGSACIIVEDYKVNRIQQRNNTDEKKLIYIPITNSLYKLLLEMGYEKYKNTDNFILAPEIGINRNRVMCDTLSKGFSHFYNQLNTEKKLTFKCLRKTYITSLQLYMGGNAKSITGHSNDQVIDTNYIDKKAIAKAAQNFNIFSQEQRAEELQEIRKENKSITKNREVEK